jgi:fucokinase
MTTTLYLSQSYKDAWGDYIRSLRSSAFPVWDYIILTASNEHQAESFCAQIEARKPYLPSKTRFVVIPDEGGERVGSGGATLSVLKWLSENGGWAGKRVLVIHSGGDSKRVPQYSALGKLFSPVPHKLPDGRSSALFDEIIISMSAVPGRIKEGMLLLSGDVLLLFNPLLIDWSGSGAAVISFKEEVETGKDHGVFLRGDDGCVRRFLHKQTVETLRAVNAVNENGMVDIDTGAILLGGDVLNSLWSLISENKAFCQKKYDSFVNSKVRLSLYGDFQYPLASDSTLDGFFSEKPEGDYSDELNECRKQIWNALHNCKLKLLRLAPAKFIHFGTTKEILALMTGGVDGYRDLGWNREVNSSLSECSGYNSVVSSGAKIGNGCYLEVSYVHSSATIGEGTILSYIDIHNEIIPSNVVIHGLKQKNGKFVCRIFGTNDNPKENKLFGYIIPDNIAPSLWLAPIYPEKNSIKEAVSAALALYEKVKAGRWDEIENGKSLASGFNDADPEAILAWNKRMEELAAMNDVQRLIDDRLPASKARLNFPLTDIQVKWLEGKLEKADPSEKMRLYYYIGKATGDEEKVRKAFSVLSDAVLKETLSELQENKDLRICLDSVEVKLPLRVNWGGGWSDTPPYCNENGGTVLNASILLNGEKPVSVRIKRIDEKKIVFESRDMDVHGEFTEMRTLQSVGDPYDPCVLQKAAFLACGVIPKSGGDLSDTLTRLGGGIWMDTEVTGVPKGSGLGTSSILAAACVKAIFEFFGTEYNEDKIYSAVLCMEQIMSTGGGWQDQVGGVTEGIKYITSRPGLKQKLSVTHLDLEESTLSGLNSRLALIYTGQRRLARNLLRDVVGNYIGNEPDTVYALNEIQKTAALMRFELERGHVDDFAALLTRHWELSKMIDKGTSNTLIEQIFDSIDDLIDGKMVCGAGGGGFLQVILKKDKTKKQLQSRLSEIFADTDIRAWECRIQ